MSAGWADALPPRACASLCRRVRLCDAVSAGQQGGRGCTFVSGVLVKVSRRELIDARAGCPAEMPSFCPSCEVPTGFFLNTCQRVTGVTHVTRFPTCIECQEKHYSVCQRTKILHDSINYVFCHSQGMRKNASHASQKDDPTPVHTQASHVSRRPIFVGTKAQTVQAIP
jgi:hypothetical protein